MRRISDLIQKEKRQIVGAVEKIANENGLLDTLEYFESLKNDDVRLNWLIRFQRFYTKNKKWVSLKDLTNIKSYLIEEVTDHEIEYVPFDIVKNIQRLIETERLIESYKSFLDLSNLDKLINEIDTNFYASRKKDSKGRTKSNIPSIDLPLPSKYIDLATEEFLKDRLSFINTGIELFPFRKQVIESIPKDIRVEHKPGKRSDYPVRKIMAVEFWANDKNEIKKRDNN